MTNSFDLQNMEPIDAESLSAISDDMETEMLPPIPETLPEYQELPPDNTQYQDEIIDYNNLVPVDENGYTQSNTAEINYDNLVPVDDEYQKTKDLGVWDEAKIKFDMGNITQYRADLAKQVWSGQMSLEDAQAMTQNRYSEILNKYGVEKVPEFSFAKFKANPFKTMFGEAAQMLPFYGEGLKKGAGYSLITVPTAIGVRGLQGQIAGATAGTAVEPGGGTAAGAAVGRVGGSVMGIIEGINTGMLLGTFHTSIDVEGMNLYMDLREKGIDDKTAKVAGISGGVLNGFLEVGSFGIVTAPIKGATKKMAAKLLWDGVKNSPAAKKMLEGAITKVTKEYFKRMGKLFDDARQKLKEVKMRGFPKYTDIATKYDVDNLKGLFPKETKKFLESLMKDRFIWVAVGDLLETKGTGITDETHRVIEVFELEPDPNKENEMMTPKDQRELLRLIKKFKKNN